MSQRLNETSEMVKHVLRGIEPSALAASSSSTTTSAKSSKSGLLGAVGWCLSNLNGLPGARACDVRRSPRRCDVLSDRTEDRLIALAMGIAGGLWIALVFFMGWLFAASMKAVCLVSKMWPC
jgi:hypothetical protein